MTQLTSQMTSDDLTDSDEDVISENGGFLRKFEYQ